VTAEAVNPARLPILPVGLKGARLDLRVNIKGATDLHMIICEAVLMKMVMSPSRA
jgi:hypothetical protein